MLSCEFLSLNISNLEHMNSVTKGKQGEDLAAAFLIKKGYSIMTRNFYYQKAEVDIIAQKEDVLCVGKMATIGCSRRSIRICDSKEEQAIGSSCRVFYSKAQLAR